MGSIELSQEWKFISQVYVYKKLQFEKIVFGILQQYYGNHLNVQLNAKYMDNSCFRHSFAPSIYRFTNFSLVYLVDKFGWTVVQNAQRAIGEALQSFITNS